ncbi:synaptic vesicle glycoprotein 2B-like isoform X2 [Athalia rosae]|uniref:synaptic vesicle glycoprotein 2B-like isoform X2 n=1 Tax=Athalia rosae TaxID=37344 RepID=UPI002033BB60|nr:synaptic vesicle glycoprotein 2B-like isoform X2 [Athalia rosae]
MFLADDALELPSDFEAAIDATGYGLFNFLLLLAILPGGWACIFDTTTMAYILPSAECDLKLTLFDKGVLNAAIFAGMFISAFIWGFLADTNGRRSLLRIGFIADAICNVLCSMSQNFYMMVFFKFLSGCIINGPYAIKMTYLAEFSGSKHRFQTLLWASLSSASSNIALPVLAWMIIPQSWSFTLFDGAFVFNSWRIFLLISSLPAFTAFLTLLYFPESPRFLMSQGRNEEALKVFRKMYTMNTGNPPESFPIRDLCQEAQKRQIERSASRKSMSAWDKTRSGWAQIKPLFRQPYLGQFLLIITIQFGGILSLNTLRLWIPQLFTLIENFDYENRDPNSGMPTLCEMISAPSPVSNVTFSDVVNGTVESTCIASPVPSRVYINSIIIAVTTVMGFTLAGNLVNLIGKKPLLLTVYAVSAFCCLILNWSPNSDATLAILAIYLAGSSVSVNTIISFIVALMPTSLRTMAVSLTMCVGRSGALIGNLLFPILLVAGCMAPFIFVGGFLMACFLLSIFIPKPPAKLM